MPSHHPDENYRHHCVENGIGRRNSSGDEKRQREDLNGIADHGHQQCCPVLGGFDRLEKLGNVA